MKRPNLFNVAVASTLTGIVLLFPYPIVGKGLLVSGLFLALWCFPGLWETRSTVSKWRRDTFKIRRLIPLTEATRRAYEKTQSMSAAAFAEQSAQQTNTDVHSWYAIAFTQSVSPAACLYGVKPPSRKVVEIPARELHGAGFKNEANDLERWGDKRLLYTNLAISRTDYKRCVKEVRTWDVTGGNSHSLDNKPHRMTVKVLIGIGVVAIVAFGLWVWITS